MLNSTASTPVGHPVEWAEAHSPARQNFSTASATSSREDTNLGTAHLSAGYDLPVAQILEEKNGRAVPAGNCRRFKSVSPFNSFLRRTCLLLQKMWKNSHE
jgi:hypothetical protein